MLGLERDPYLSATLCWFLALLRISASGPAAQRAIAHFPV
jgi:hypothetical protein